MALVALEGMRFFAYHGFYDEERVIGNNFILDIFIETDISDAKVVVEEDGIEKVANTINYETVYDICRLQMKQPQKLLESVLDNILLALRWQFSTIQHVKIRIRKLNPPVGGSVAWSLVEQEMHFVSQCGRCGRGMICYNDATCWCREPRAKIHPRTMEMVSSQFKGCLCERCLKEYSG